MALDLINVWMMLFHANINVLIVPIGGTVFIVMREEYLTYVREYVNRLEPYMDTLQEQGLWKRVN